MLLIRVMMNIIIIVKWHGETKILTRPKLIDLKNEGKNRFRKLQNPFFSIACTPKTNPF